MISKNCDKGMIFLCQDKCNMNNKFMNGKHNYLIIGVNQGNNEHLGFIQTMSITSMRSKTIGMEVPIKLCNDYISYVIPYNLHSYLPSEIDIRNYKGCIVDTPRISKNDFITLLMDIYMDSMGIGNHDEVVQRYNDYCKKFWDEFKDIKEYRMFEEERYYSQKVVGESEEVAMTTEYEETLIQQEPLIVNNTHENITKTTNSSFRKKDRKKSKKLSKQRDEKWDNKLWKKMIQEESWNETAEEEIVEESFELPEAEPLVQRLVIPSGINNIFFSGKVKLEDMKRFQGVPRMTSRWSDNDLIDFSKGYKEYGYNKMHEMIPNRWTSPSAMSHQYKTVCDEAKKRGLKIDKDPLRRPLKEWSDDDLQKFILIMNNHKYDDTFQIQYTGYDNINQVSAFIYKVKKEMSNRKLI